MRISQAAIRGGRPTTRFAFPVRHRRERQLGLRRTTSVRLATAPTRDLGLAPLAAIHSAARALSRGKRAADGRTGDVGARLASVRELRRPDSITWSQITDSGPHRSRARTAAPWRG